MHADQILKDNHLKIASCVRRDFPNRPSDIDDLIQEALIAFHIALKKMSISKCNNVFSYCYQSAKWRCLDWLRKKDKTSKHTSNVTFFNGSEHSKSSNHLFDEVIAGEATLPLEQFLHDQGIKQGNPCTRLSELELLEKTLDNYSYNHKQLLLFEFYGIKPDDSYKALSECSVIRIKQRYKQDYLKLTGTG